MAERAKFIVYLGMQLAVLLYTLGDSDTKSDAKKIAFIEAKRLCLEKAGSYIKGLR